MMAEMDSGIIDDDDDDNDDNEGIMWNDDMEWWGMMEVWILVW